MILLLVKSSLAFLIASSIAWVELVTAKYPRTIGLFRGRSWALWVYAFIYGIISFVFTFWYADLVESGLFGLRLPAGQARTPSFLVAIMAGFATKGLLHVRLFTVVSSGSEFPVGTETIVQLFEPYLLRTIALDESLAVTDYSRKKAARYPRLDEVRRRLIEGLPGPNMLAKEEKQARQVELEKAETTRAAIELYLRAFGAVSLEQHLPDRRRA